jgi:uncharacterized protein
LKIAIEDIREGVSTLEFVCKPEEVGLESEGICFTGNVIANLRLFRQLDKVFVKAELTTPIELECARCLNPVEVILKGAFENQYRPLPKAVKETLDDIGIRYYSEEYIDLSDDFRESLLLELPIKALCSESCEGLCPGCGKNLNKGKCDCHLESEAIGGSKLAEFAELAKMLELDGKLEV